MIHYINVFIVICFVLLNDSLFAVDDIDAAFQTADVQCLRKQAPVERIYII